MQVLLDLFRGHQIDAHLSGDWVTFPGHDYHMSAHIASLDPTIHTVQLDVLFDLGDGRLLVESFAGGGDSDDEAATDAVNSFVINSFHVLLRAFFITNDDQVLVEKWSIDGTPRRVVIGNMGFRGQHTNPDIAPNEWFQEFEAKLKTTPLGPGLHWVRIYYSQMNNQTMAIEVLLDNQPWDSLKESLTEVEWPKEKEFFSVRVFMVITDE